ncbi:hypothetical protein HETIRDRAFT_477546 [Heterobasidion irregulare TC 32-1]|uniref:Uncharacterized protein n=1 Tax=Heterobasidion irregulare (strain TC 32-1) TaxID=747525 RepID=W4K3J1_HETIT|nr:uncharacterized protein HETIRDRAFT_477546 [Heterobasidion irregulare TC 32-1]ETW79905.1 hypothetical protein HETIRDRAFT_477546 [Heterobasidion irregulare TC 32-1]
MWSKLSNALKRSGNEQYDTEPLQTLDVMSSVLKQHPNLSVFHEVQDQEEPTEVPFPIPSPPGSPSLNGRRGMFKRMSKGKIDLMEGAMPSPPPLKLPLPLKKVKAHLTLPTNGSETSLRSPDSATHAFYDTSRPSLDSIRLPESPVDSKFSSIRSILRDRNTPGTGQSVRFFSRDAYKVISPDVSAASEAEEPPLIERLQNAGGASKSEISRARNRPRASPINVVMAPIPLDLSNIFDLSPELDVPFIAPVPGTTLLDSAVEIIDDDEEEPTVTPQIIAPNSEEPTIVLPIERLPIHDRSYSFSFGQKVFSALPTVPADKIPLDAATEIARSPSRNRSMSDTFFNPKRTAKAPESDINDISTSSFVVYSAPAERAEPDPFRANATTYYTPGAVIPPTPPKGMHARKVSREEDEIFSLRTQLALQQEMCAQYELDLGARDELVNTLNLRLEVIEKDADKRKSLLRGWKKKVQELERMCRHLEEEVENSRQESFERSIMDEASGEALTQLHRRISDLERENGEIVKRGEGWRAEREHKEELLREQELLLAKLKDELSQRDVGETLLKEGIRNAKEQMEEMMLSSAEEDLESAVMVQEHEQERRHQVSLEWDEERSRLITAADEAQRTREALESELDKTRGALLAKEQEVSVLTAELEAQWKNTEVTGERMEELKREKAILQNELVSLEGKLESMETDWSNSENKRLQMENEINEALAAKDELDRQRDQLEEELRSEQEHSDQLTQSLREREGRVNSLEQELKYALDNAARLEQRVQQRDADVEELAHKVVAREDEVEDVREALSTAKREHARALDEQRRAVIDLSALEGGARTQLEAAIKAKAEADVAASTMKDRVAALEQDIERLHKQVHTLKTESADKEVSLVQMEKQRDHLRDDVQGLTIALDSKQQELELLKRRMGVKGTAGTTPAPSKATTHRRESSSAFTTPSINSRPSSRLSDGSKDVVKVGRLSEPPSSTRPTTLGKSVRTNGSASSTPSTSTGLIGTPSTAKPLRANGSIGPPPVKPRMSAATPTPSHSRSPPTSVPRSSIAAHSSTSSTPMVSNLRRASSAAPAEISRTARPNTTHNRSVVSPVISKRDEKENTEPQKRRSPVIA